MLSARESVDLSHVESRLLEKFVPSLRIEDVRRCLAAAEARHRSARVRTYLSILIERTAMELLTVELRAAVTAEVVDLRTRVVRIDGSNDEHPALERHDPRRHVS